MALISTIIIAILQGITELFPVSSLGHAVVLPPLLRLRDMDIQSEHFLPLLVVLHVGTAVALMLYFWRDWLGIASAFFDRDPARRKAQFRLLALVVIGTIPAVIVGFVLENTYATCSARPISRRSSSSSTASCCSPSSD